MIITSINNQIIKEAISLKKPQKRNETQMFLIEGYHLLEMAKKAKKIIKVFAIDKNHPLLKDIPFYEVSENVLKKLSSSVNPQGVVAICKMNDNSLIKSNHILYLDGVSDPGNMGTILRTALAFNYRDIIASNDCASFYNEKVIAASQGAIFDLNLINGDINYLKSLKEHDYQIVISTLNNDSEDINKIELQEKYVLVFGNEARGVSQNVIALGSIFIKIPIHNIDSLNVGVAAGIILQKFR